MVRSLHRPIMLLLLAPMCLSLCMYSATLFGIIYLFFGSFQFVFEQVYGFDLSQRGVSFMGLLVGMLIAMLSDPFWRRIYRRTERNSQSQNSLDFECMPEWRLPPGICPNVFVHQPPLFFLLTLYSL